MKEQILKLRSEGKTYKEIVEELQCAKSTVSYYCGEGQTEKRRKRQQKLRGENTLILKMDHFKNNNNKKTLRDRSDCFQRRDGSKSGKRNINFTYKDVLKKYGSDPKCYLTGRALDLNDPKDYQFDHVIPASRGGDNSLDNLGLACKIANQAKADMLVPELLEVCKEMLEHNGFKVIRME